MTRTAVFIGIDWGSTNRRIFAISDDGEVVSQCTDQSGARALSPGDYVPSLAAIHAKFGNLPILASGMIGSTIGWLEAPYAACPAGLDDLASALIEAPVPNVTIVPGVAMRDCERPDVMRGEEVQILGAAHGRLLPNDALICQPGTHSKWARLDHGRIAGFHTALTGELFALLEAHSMLAPLLQTPVTAGRAFLDGIVDGYSGDLLRGLFTERARVLLDCAPAEDSSARISGLIIGRDLFEAGITAGDHVHILAAGLLAELYGAALSEVGAHPISIDCNAAFICGIHALWRMTR